MIDELADVPPEEFVAARDELARQLKADGKADEAAAVKKLRKPTVAQWLIEQVRRHHTDALDALRTASSEVAQAQEAAITRGDRDALRTATAGRRDAVAALGRVVDTVIARNDRAAHHRDEVLAAVESAVTDDVAAGTLGLRDDLELPELPPREPQPDRVAERRAAVAAAAIEAAEARVSRAREELAKAEAELDEVRVALRGLTLRTRAAGPGEAMGPTRACR